MVKISKNANFVIDASISGIIGIMDTIKKICSTKSKIILTSVTIKELEMMQKYHDGDAYGARKILAMAAGNYDNFECVLIDENVGIPDDCIIKYCEDNKDNVVLLTSDKTMELKARTYGIQTLFFKQTKNTHTTTTPNSGIKVETIYAARRIGKKLIISDFGNNLKSIRVISDSIEYNTGVVELKIGDDIYIAVKKYDYVTFAHYNIVSLTAENNCKLVCSKRFYNLSEIDNLPIASYKSFMRDFIHKID